VWIAARWVGFFLFAAARTVLRAQRAARERAQARFATAAAQNAASRLRAYGSLLTATAHNGLQHLTAYRYSRVVAGAKCQQTTC